MEHPEEDEGEGEEAEEEVIEVLEDDEPPHEEEEVNRHCKLVSNALYAGFDDHVEALVQARKRRQEALAFRSAIEDGGAAGADDPGGGTQTQDELDGMGVKLPTDQWQGDTNMRTLQKLLSRVDARGFERSAQQLEFHEAFMKAAARVIYKGSWETDRPMIMEKYGWDRCNSEVLISTPRRFGKTFSCALSTRLCARSLSRAHVYTWQHCHLLRLPGACARPGDCRLLTRQTCLSQAPRAYCRIRNIGRWQGQNCRIQPGSLSDCLIRR